MAPGPAAPAARGCAAVPVVARLGARPLLAIGRDQRPLRQPGRHQRCGQPGRDRRRAAQQPAPAAAGRGAGARARPRRHPALGRRQGQPVLPARLQPRPWHGLRLPPQWHARQPAHARPWSGLQRPELPPARAGAARALPEGPLLRAQRRLRRRRRGRFCLPHPARCAAGPAEPGPAPLPPRRAGRVDRGAAGCHLAGRGGSHGQRRPLDLAARPAPAQRRVHLERWHGRTGLAGQCDGLQRPLDSHRPGAAAPAGRRTAGRSPLRPLRCGGHERRRRYRPLQSFVRLARVSGRTHDPRAGLRNALPPGPALELHLRAGSP